MYVVQGENHPALYSKGLSAIDVNWINTNLITKNEFACTAKFRYRQPDQIVNVKISTDNKIEVIFDEKQKSITPGQSVVFYDGDICLGGGTIDLVYS